MRFIFGNENALGELIRISSMTGSDINNLPMRSKSLFESNVKKQVMTIPLHGVMMPDPEEWRIAYFGACSTMRAIRACRVALAESSIKKVIISVDSIGGEVGRISILSKLIEKLAKTKEVVVYICGECSSAAYWSVCGATSIQCLENTNVVGSIGAYVTLTDSSGMYKSEGLVQYLLSSGELKGIATEGIEITESQLKMVQSLVTDMSNQFFSTVKRTRQVSDMEYVSQGGVYSAKEATSLGLVDQILKEIEASSIDIPTNGACLMGTASQKLSRLEKAKCNFNRLV